MEREQISYTLFKQLKVLHSYVVKLIFKRRVRSYHKEANVDEDEILRRPLSAQIDRIAASEESSNHGAKIVASAIEACSIEGDGDRQSIPIMSRIRSGLTSYFKKSKRGTLVNSCMREKMKESTREHVHSALRFARQGQLEYARFHADVATNALKEAAHYMSDGEFMSLSSEIEESLKKIV